MEKGIVFMGVALGARHRNSHPNGHGRIDSVDNCRIAKLFVVGPPLTIGHRVAMECSGHEICLSGMVKQVAGQLLDRKLFDRHIPIERVDDPISIRPDSPWRIIGVASRVGVAC